MQVGSGSPRKLGATPDESGVNFAVFSRFAERIEVCLFAEDARKETDRIALPERTGDIWHGHIAGLAPGAAYGLRAHGPHAPEQGHRFNPNKLLIDPYARLTTGSFELDDTIFGYCPDAAGADLTFNALDSAHAVPKAVVPQAEQVQRFERPETPWDRTVIYEAHVKGLTMQHPRVPPDQRGTFAGMASDPIIEHLLDLGVTAVELLPVHARFDEPDLSRRGLTNYWGYNTIGYFMPEPRYCCSDAIGEFRHMVRRLHAAGIEVILDVVYNHTGEGSELGPTLSFRGLDNASYYRLHAECPRRSVNDTGCGNTLDLSRPMVLRLVLDSLRYWVQEMGVDGFRFDLATTLGREPHGFDPASGFFDALLQDPVLAGCKLIAEPWDVGPGGYQLGGFPPPVAEWNDAYRDGVRKFWRGDVNTVQDLAARLLASADRFDRGGRRPWSSINCVCSHDGFTLEDLVSHGGKHNHANGEGNLDGHDANYSSNCGFEGPTDNPDIRAERARRKRNLIATLLVSQGTPMLLAGDELGNGQSGNNNAYCQDNPLGWIDWDQADEDLSRFVSRMTGIRKDHPVLRQAWFLHGRKRPANMKCDVTWHGPTGVPPDWADPELHHVGLELRCASDAACYASTEDALFIVFNSGDAIRYSLPCPEDGHWMRVLDTGQAGGGEAVPVSEGHADIARASLALFSLLHD